MKTTLSIDDDAFSAAKELAAQQHKSISEVISTLIRQAFKLSTPNIKTRNGIPLLPTKEAHMSITPELIRHLDNELP